MGILVSFLSVVRRVSQGVVSVQYSTYGTVRCERDKDHSPLEFISIPPKPQQIITHPSTS